MTQKTVTVTNQTQFNAALRAASAPGAGPETILLAPGVYAGDQVYNETIPSNLTIESASTTHQAILEDFKVQNSSNITLKNLTFTNTQSADPVGDVELQLTSDTNVTVSNCLFTGDASNKDAAKAGLAAIHVNGGSGISISDSTFQYVQNGVQQTGVDGLNVSNNVFQWIFDDGVDGGGSNNVSVIGNYFTDMHVDPTDTVHPDCIQFWTSGYSVDQSNITVENNTYVRGAGTPIQGIFITSQNSVGYENVTVADNTIDGAQYNGIWVDSASNAQVFGNVVQPYADISSRLIVSNLSSGSVTNNVAGSIFVEIQPLAITTGGDVTTSAIPIPAVNAFVSAAAAMSGMSGASALISSNPILPQAPRPAMIQLALNAHQLI